MITIAKIIPENSHKRAMATWYVCEVADRCPLHAKGKCACFQYILGKNLTCPNAEYRSVVGPTKRAKSYSAWIDNMRETVQKTADEYNKKLSLVADYVFCPMPYLDVLSGQKVDGVINEHFFRIEDFTACKVEEIVNFVPRTFFENAPIRDYKEKEVPKFLQQLKEEMPELYKKWTEKYPETAEKYKEVSNVGRTAYISTLPDGCTFKGYTKKGKYLETDKEKSVLFNGSFGSKKPLNVRVRIEDDMVIKVTENMITDENTKFVD